MGILDMLLKLDARRQGAVLDDQEARVRRQQTEQGVGLAAALRRAGKGPGAPVAQPDGTFKTPVDPEAAAAISLMQDPGSRGLGNQLATNVLDPAWQQGQQLGALQIEGQQGANRVGALREAFIPTEQQFARDQAGYAASQDRRDELRTMSYVNNLSLDNAYKVTSAKLTALNGALKTEGDLRNEYQKAPLLIKGAQAMGSFSMLKKALDEDNAMALQAAIVATAQIQEPGLAVRNDDRIAYSGNNPVTDQLVQAFNTAVSGEGLTPGVKMRLLGLGTKMAGVHANNIQRVTEDYRKLAINTPGARQDQVTIGVGIDWDMVNFLAEVTKTQSRGPGSR